MYLIAWKYFLKFMSMNLECSQKADLYILVLSFERSKQLKTIHFTHPYVYQQ
jgi:hypothetical protein